MDRSDTSPPDHSCDYWREWISALADGEGTPQEQVCAWAHLKRCADCRRFYASLVAVKRRLRKVHWSQLWSEAIRSNVRLRRWALVAVGLALLLSGLASSYLVRRFWHPPTMTPLVAAALYHQHRIFPPEVPVNHHCPTGFACQVRSDVFVRPLPQMAVHTLGHLRDVGICHCSGRPVLIYRLSHNGHLVFLVLFNTDHLPIEPEPAGHLMFAGRRVSCSIVSGLHILFWRSGQQGEGIIVPQGRINPFLLMAKIPESHQADGP
ncbi:MAG: hypothetical protein NZ959_02485 [Armatimonadetes bacterium]|nr:hypothetical protein [Armatimonadota bacterium]MDW8120960.1 hypothetical protein [Armatimonadota bacterium]